MKARPCGADILIDRALHDLRRCRHLLLLAGSRKAAERVRLAITSTGGALRHAKLAAYRDERRARKAARP